jgi:broad specificity phosphatase PhoE
VPRLILVRHGEASAAWGDDPDPGLSDVGRAQASAVADALAPLGPLAIQTSPLRRCRETAAPLAARWGTEPVISTAVAEIPSPPGVALAERSAWLLSLGDRTWSDADADTARWRAEAVAAVRDLPGDTVVFTHFVAINVLVGAATGDERVFVARFANCSRTIIDVTDGRLQVAELGAEADSTIG